MKALHAIILALAVSLVLGFAMSQSGCSLFRGVQQLEQMDDLQLSAFADRTAFQFATVAQAAVSEGDLTVEQVQKVATVFDGLSKGSVGGITGSVSEYLEGNGYAAVGLAIAVSELDAELEARGAFEEGGVLSPKAKTVFGAIATELAKVSAPGG